MTIRMSAHDYSPPWDTGIVTRDDVHLALEFLIAIEPASANSKAEYQAATALYREPIAAAMATLRRFGRQIMPLELEAMQVAYYGFTNAPRYLRSSVVSSVVTSALLQGWHGIGPWRR